ncbi:MAG: bile acid:sodium symporter family protein [Pirellulales bacterium]
MQFVRKLCLGSAGLSVLLLLAGVVAGRASIWQPAAVAASIGLAIGLGGVRGLRTYQFTAWIIAAVVVAMIYPAFLQELSPDNAARPNNKWLMLVLVQLVMFGMGTQMSVRDFAELGHNTWAVVVGVLLQFSVMPLLGYGLATAFGFSPEVAAGIVLIGSCSSGLASNVMTYLAGANLALSIALTAAGTLLAPLTTPFWMYVLAGDKVPVDFVGMMLQIMKIVIAPIGAALLHDYLKRASPAGERSVQRLALCAAVWLAALQSGGWEFIGRHLQGNALAAVGVLGYLCAAVVVGVLFHALWRQYPAIEARMPLFSMFGIIFFTAVTTATGRDELLHIGKLLICVSILHNLIGLVLGYSLARLLGLDERAARTLALEVGIQNGAMASGLASEMSRLGTVGLAPAVFSPWQNVSGSILANYWRKRPPADDPQSTEDA